jgi:hypothetical protein
MKERIPSTNMLHANPNLYQYRKTIIAAPVVSRRWHVSCAHVLLGHLIPGPSAGGGRQSQSLGFAGFCADVNGCRHFFCQVFLSGVGEFPGDCPAKPLGMSNNTEGW